MPTLLFRDTFAEDANLRAHTPTPNGGPAWDYVGVDGRYVCNLVGTPPPDGFLDGPIGTTTDPHPGRNAYSIPVGVKRWRVQADIRRGGVDFVGGGFSVLALCSDDAIGTWTRKNHLVMVVTRRQVNEVSVAVTYTRPDTPGPLGVTLLTAGVVHPANTTRRYIMEVDELTGTVALYKADAVTGANETAIDDGESTPVTGSGLFTAELADHVANDTTHRLVAVHGGWTTSGAVYFAASDLQVWALELPTVGVPCTLLLQVYDDDGFSVLWEAATDPLHANPYLVDPGQLGEQEVDFAKGAASVGTITVEVIDKNVIPGDQDSGFLTGKLAAFGIPTLGGRRCRLIRFIPDGNGYQILADGPASQPQMDASYAAFKWQIRDTREIERKLRMFDLVSESGPAAISGALPSVPTQPGTDPDYTWGLNYH